MVIEATAFLGCLFINQSIAFRKSTSIYYVLYGAIGKRQHLQVKYIDKDLNYVLMEANNNMVLITLRHTPQWFLGQLSGF